MRELRQEHKALRQLILLLQRKLNMLENDIPLNYRLIEDVINYIEDFANAYHHPKEDVIYHYIIDHNLDDRGQFHKILQEHKTLLPLTQSIKATLHSILLDIIVSRETFISELSTFIEAQKAHLDSEDQCVFPLIEPLLNEKDWVIILQNLPEKVEDPIFGKEIHSSYQDLYNRLQIVEEN